MKRCSSNFHGDALIYGFKIDQVPDDVMEFIFSYLNWTGIQVTSLVCKKWAERTVNVVHGEQKKTIQFFKMLEGSLNDEDAREKNRMDFATVELSSQIKIRDIQLALDGSKEDALNILKNVQPENLDLIEKQSIDKIKPRGFENIFKLARLYRAIDSTLHKPSRRKKIADFGQIALGLAEHDHFHKSLEVALRTRDYSDAPLEDFDHSMYERGFIPKLTQAAGLLKPYRKSTALLRISQILLNKGDLEGSLQAIKDIPYKSISVGQIKQVFNEFMKRQDFIHALETADLLDLVDEVIHD